MGRVNNGFYHKKKVLITGHTGFKGTWLCKLLSDAGAEVTGYALEPSEPVSLFELSGVRRNIESVNGDIRDSGRLKEVFQRTEPEIVIHMAAQPIVRESYRDPVYTYETNVMGTVHICECIRNCASVRSFVNVTTDKVYKNLEWVWPYRETDILDGRDPYSNSKSCSELITNCYRSSFFQDRKIALSTVRAGNVIGGGDFSKDRIIPDCVAAALNGRKIMLRNPDSIRPYQHVLEALSVYLMIAEKQYKDPGLAGAYNVGPDEADSIKTSQLAELFCDCWGDGLVWESHRETGPKENRVLRLDNSLLKSTFHWRPRWNIRNAVEKTVEWTKMWIQGQNVSECMEEQIKEFTES